MAKPRLTPFVLFGLLAGVAADRWNRKHLMIAADAVRAAAMAALGAALLLRHAELWEILLVARSSRARARRSSRWLRPARSAPSSRRGCPPPRVRRRRGARPCRESDSIAEGFRFLWSQPFLRTVSARATVAVFAVFGLVLALWETLSASIRNAPSLDELPEAPSLLAR